MTTKHQLESVRLTLEKTYGTDAVYDLVSGLFDSVVLGHGADDGDNPYMPNEQPCHGLYQTGSRLGKELKQKLAKAKPAYKRMEMDKA